MKNTLLSPAQVARSFVHTMIGCGGIRRQGAITVLDVNNFISYSAGGAIPIAP